MLIKIDDDYCAFPVWVCWLNDELPEESRQHIAQRATAELGIGPHYVSGLTFLSSALWAMFHLGNRLADNPIAQNLARKQQTSAARESIQSESAKIDAEIRSKMGPVLDNHPTWNAHRVATEIAPSVNGLNLRNSAIEKRVRRLMQSSDG